MKHSIKKEFIQKICDYLNDLNTYPVITYDVHRKLRKNKYKVDNNIFYTAISLGYFVKEGDVYVSKVKKFEPTHSRKLIEVNRQYHRNWLIKNNKVEKEDVVAETPKEANIYKLDVKPTKKKVSILWGLIKLEY